MMNDQPTRLRYNAEDVAKARELRNTTTPAERKLWELLRVESKQRKFCFRRQCPIHPYIVDFACLKLKLVIELDSWSHDSRQAYDAQRDKYLQGLDYKIMRFANDEVLRNPEGVTDTIMSMAESLNLDETKNSSL